LAVVIILMLINDCGSVLFTPTYNIRSGVIFAPDFNY
jgi:hypothetical protein